MDEARQTRFSELMEVINYYDRIYDDPTGIGYRDLEGLIDELTESAVWDYIANAEISSIDNAAEDMGLSFETVERMVKKAR